EFELFARRHADHLLDQVDAGHQLGDGMLDLQPRVHFEEVKTLVLADHELHGSGGVVADGLGERDRLLAHFAARRRVDERTRRFLDHFLVAALDRAFALAEMNDVAVLVTEHLDFNMARINDEFLDEQPIVAEGGFGFRTRARKTLGDLGLGTRDPHALAAAACRCLDHHRISDLVRDLHRVLDVSDHAKMTGNGGHFGLRRRPLAFDLVAHGGDRLGIGTDEDDAGLRQRLGEGLALGQKAVARMHRLGAGALAGGDDLVDDEIALGCRRRADRHGLVGHFDVQRVAVGVGIDRNSCDSQAARGLDDPAGDLAAIGDQDTLEHAAIGTPRIRRFRLCGAAGQMSTAVHGARKANVNQPVAPRRDRHPDAGTARSAANRPRPMAAPMAILLTVSLATAARMAMTACARLKVSGVRRSIETLTASTSTSPTTIAPATAPVAPNASPSARPSTMITPRKTANPRTDRRSNGLRNFTLRYASRSSCCQVIQAMANPTTVSAAAISAGATSTSRSGLSAATMPITRRNMTADAIATPAASSRGEPSRAAARRALAMVTAVEDATPPAAAASSNPRRAPKYFTAAWPRKETRATTMAMSQPARRLTPPNGPRGVSGKIGRPMKVMASNTTADRNSGHVICSTQPWSSSRAASKAVAATAAPAAMRMSPMSA